MIYDVEIKASTRVSGKRWFASVDAARRRVKDGEYYLIRRHNSYFRDDSSGYTTFLSAAGVYTTEKARSYLDVEGVSVVPLSKIRGLIQREIEQTNTAACRLYNMIALLNGLSPTPTNNPPPVESKKT